MPLPTFSEDEVTNFLVAEALVHRTQLERNDANAAQKSQQLVESHKDAAKRLVPSGGGRA